MDVTRVSRRPSSRPSGRLRRQASAMGRTTHDAVNRDHRCGGFGSCPIGVCGTARVRMRSTMASVRSRLPIGVSRCSSRARFVKASAVDDFQSSRPVRSRCLLPQPRAAVFARPTAPSIPPIPRAPSPYAVH
jgi:hypothetical protein